jgi:hypothetical protein
VPETVAAQASKKKAAGHAAELESNIGSLRDYARGRYHRITAALFGEILSEFDGL